MAEAECPRCEVEEETPDHIVFRCRKIKRVKDTRGRRECARVGLLGCISLKEVGEDGGSMMRAGLS